MSFWDQHYNNKSSNSNSTNNKPIKSSGTSSPAIDPFADLVTFRENPSDTKKTINQQLQENKRVDVKVDNNFVIPTEWHSPGGSYTSGSRNDNNTSMNNNQNNQKQDYFSHNQLDLDFFSSLDVPQKLNTNNNYNNNNNNSSVNNQSDNLLDPFSTFDKNTKSTTNNNINSEFDLLSDYKPNPSHTNTNISTNVNDFFSDFKDATIKHESTHKTNYKEPTEQFNNLSINDEDTLFDAKLAELLSYGYDLDSSKMALSMTNNDVIEAKQLMDEQKKVELQNKSKPPLPQRREYDSDDDEDNYSYDYKNQRQGLFDKTKSLATNFNTDQLLNQANELGTSMFSAANKLFMKSKQTLNSTWQDIKLKQSSGTDTPNSNNSRTYQYYGDSSDEEEADNGGDFVPFKDEVRDYSVMENQRSTSFNDRLSPVNRANPVGRASPLSKPNSIGRNSPVSRANLISKVEKPLPKDSIIIDNAQLNLVENIKNEGNHYFKLGQFTRSIENYTKAIESIPNEHSSLIVIYNNRANSYSKMGNFKNSLNDSELALKIIGEDYEYVPKQKLEGKAGLNLKDYYVKGMLRKAEALEALERFKEAEETYAKLLFLSNCSAHNKALEGARRCKKGLEVPKLEKKGSEAGGRNDKLDSLLSEFSTDFDKLTAIKNAKPKVSKQEIDSSEAVKKIRELENIKNQEETIRIQTIDSIEAKVKSWKSSKEDNLRALLASLDDVLWGELNWKKVPIHDLLDLKKVKRVYMLAIAKLHPDKLTSSATVEQKLLAASIFTTLNLAWDQFKLQNNL